MSRFAQGNYQVQNPSKYVGKGTPRFRSGQPNYYVARNVRA